MTWLENRTVEPESAKRASSRRITSADTWIHAFQRLVQEQHRRVVDQGTAERGLLAHVRGVVGDQPFRVRGRVQHVQQLRSLEARLPSRASRVTARRTPAAPHH